MTLQQNRPRPTVPRAIVPAIPLPYIQKRKQQQAAREKAASQEAVQATQATAVEAPPSSTPSPTELPPSVVNDSSERNGIENFTELRESTEVEADNAPVLDVEEETVDSPADEETNAPVEDGKMGE
jgi:hypothetical protein